MLVPHPINQWMGRTTARGFRTSLSADKSTYSFRKTEKVPSKFLRPLLLISAFEMNPL